jgi:hypothetical protein
VTKPERFAQQPKPTKQPVLHAMRRERALTLPSGAALVLLTAAASCFLPSWAQDDACFKRANEWPVQSCDRTRCNDACECAACRCPHAVLGAT